MSTTPRRIRTYVAPTRRPKYNLRYETTLVGIEPATIEQIRRNFAAYVAMPAASIGFQLQPPPGRWGRIRRTLSRWWEWIAS